MGAAWSFAEAAAVFADLASKLSAYAGLTYSSLARVEAQWPPVGRDDLYYGGTVYDNSGGAGARTGRGEAPSDAPAPAEPTMEALTRPQPALYRSGELIRLSDVIGKRLV
jgi:NADH-quinone oxidoreductase subunit G